MRKRIYKLTAILMAFAMILCNNSIISLAEEIVPETEEDVYEEVLEEDAEEGLPEAEEMSEVVSEEEELPSEEVAEESTEIEEESEVVEESEVTEESSEEEMIEDEPEEEEITEASDDIVAIENLDADGNIASGKSNNVEWVIDANGKLTISGTGDWETDEYGNPPWRGYYNDILTAEVKLTSPTSLINMFHSCNELRSVNLSGLDSSKVTDMSGMFDHCRSLTELDLSSFDTTNVTDMSGMFDYCRSLTELDLSGFDTTNVTDMSEMFCDCTILTELDLSGFDTTNVTDMSEMFRDCTILTELDLSTFVINSACACDDCFSNACIEIIKSPKECNAVITLPIIYINDSGEEITLMPRTSNVLTIGDFWAKGDSNNIHWEIRSNRELTISGTGDWDLDEDPPWHRVSNCIKSAKVTVTGITDTRRMFMDCRNLTTVDLSGLDTSNVTCMNYMFLYCSSLKELDLSGFVTSNVREMTYMFAGCTSLTELDLSSFDTSNVRDVGFTFMFDGCTSLTKLDLSGFATTNVTDMAYMFDGCTSLTELDLSGFDTSNVAYMCEMFSGCTSLTKLDLSGFDTTNVTDMYNMFAGCTSLTELDLSSFSISQEDRITNFLLGCDNLSLIITPQSVSQVIDLPKGKKWKDLEGNVYTELSAIPKIIYADDYIDIKNIPENAIASGVSNSVIWYIDEAGKLTVSGYGDWEMNHEEGYYGYDDYAPWYEYREVIKSADINLIGTVDASNMFCGCENITSVDLSKFDTSRLKCTYYMFRECKKLTSIDFSHFDTSKVTDMGGMFVFCESLISLDLSNFVTSNVQNMESMFEGCKALKEVVLSNFDTSKVQLMSWLFADCESLLNLDLSSFTINNEVETFEVFKDGRIEEYIVTPKECNEVVELPAGNWKDENGKIYSTIPETSTKLINLNDRCLANGTSNKVSWILDIDGHLEIYGTGDWKGKAPWSEYKEQILSATVTLTNSSYLSKMFDGCSKMTSVTLSGLDTSKVSNMEYMFRDCSSLTEIDLSNFDTSNSLYFCNMFENCSGLTSLDLSSFSIGNDSDIDDILKGCTELHQLTTPVTCLVHGKLPTRIGKTWRDSNGESYLEFPRESKVLILCEEDINTYTIVYELNGGTNSQSNPETYEKGSTVTLKNPVKEGHAFVGWFDKDTDEKVTSIADKNIIIYAKWIPYTYTVTLNGNGGKYITDDGNTSTVYKHNMTFGIPSVLENPFEKYGYTLVGWTTQKNGKGTFYEAGTMVGNLTKINNGNVNLYAKWTASKYSIVFDINAHDAYEDDLTGEMPVIEATYTKSVKLPTNAFTRKGYSFKGWALTPDAAKAKYKNKASVKNLADRGEATLYAVWSVNTYSVKFNANGGKGKAPVTLKGLQYGIKDFALPANSFTNKDFYTFAGWNTKKDGTGDMYDEGQLAELVAKKNKQALTLYATWSYEFDIILSESEKAPYSAYYNQSVTADQIMEDIPELAKTGQYIAGFAISQKNADKGKMAYKGAVKNAPGKDLYPVYKTNKYTVKFDKNAPEGAKVSGKMSSISATYGKSFTLKANAFKCNGHTFKGWSTDKDATVAEFTNKAQITKNLSEKNKDVVVLYAIWE